LFRIFSALAGGALSGIAAYVYLDMEYAKWPMERRLYIAAGCAVIGGIAGVLAGRAAQKR
jgi:hypothetical protein